MTKTILILLLGIAPHFVHAQNHEGWFPFRPKGDAREDALNMSSWLDKPAGNHGFLTMDGKDFRFEDGKKVKFWGVNICSDEPFPDEEKTKQWVRFLSKYGINGVRFHKFTWDATDGYRSTVITDDHWKRFDRFCHALREGGIYYSWSHIYGHRVMPADSARLLAYSEVSKTRFPWAHLNGTTSSLVNFAEDLQALNIELTVNMLNHVNPHTGKRYAEDPALTFIELQNEDNIYWGAIEETLKQTPTYRKLLCAKFSRWLRNKYKTQEALQSAWENSGLGEGESLLEENIYPHPNHGMFSYHYEEFGKTGKPVPRYIADRATFLFQEQHAFYSRFVKAIRGTGYKGVIIGSCWQAGSGISHFFNLLSDYEAGAIDRHNYFGGGGGHTFKPGKFDNRSMLIQPGSGLLSTGFQMVLDRPFQISEWMSLIPTEWVAESSPLIAAYGMGLQGWDASYAFAMDYTHFTETLQRGHGIYNVTSPLQLALYPALAAMVYRGDVKEGDVAVNRDISTADLRNGSLKLDEQTSQSYDIKSFKASVPLESIAVGPVSVTFDKPGVGTFDRTSEFIDEKRKQVTSNTKQLVWDYSGRGHFTINTAGTKGLVGFAGGKSFDLVDVSIKADNPFAVVLITSLNKDKGLSDAKKILITAMARAANTGMKFNADTTALVETGRAPLLIEPVTVTLRLKRKGDPVIHVLDHSGSKTGVTIPRRNGEYRIDGRETKAIYYLVEYR